MGSLSDYFNRVMSGPPFRPGEEMKYEAIRLSTFKEWPHWANAQPTLLAKAGFYYTSRDHEDDEVCCFSCKGKLKEWQRGDDPTSEHRRWFPECPYITGLADENVPLQAPASFEFAANLPPAVEDSRSRNFGNDQEEGSTLAGSQPNAGRDRPLDNLESHTENNGTSSTSTYHYRFEENRLKSFANWPSRFVEPAALAKAGFYFLGDFDRVQCAFCRGILRKWEPGDSAMVEHKKHFPDCPFMCERNVGNVPMISEDVRKRNIGPGRTVRLSVIDRLEYMYPEREVEERKNQNLQDRINDLCDRINCIICLENERNCLLLPCHHYACCDTCVQYLNKCPVCRCLIKGHIKVFNS